MLHQVIEARAIFQLHKVRGINFDFIFLLNRLEDERDEKMIEESIAVLDFFVEEIRVDRNVADFGGVARLVFANAWLGHAQGHFEVTCILLLDQFVEFALGNVLRCRNLARVTNVDEELLTRVFLVCFDANPCDEKKVFFYLISQVLDRL